MTEEYKKFILSKVPHDHDGEFEGSENDVSEMAKILLRNGYAILVTPGTFENEYSIHWLYAGTTEVLHEAQYKEICFARVETIEEYIDILREEWEDRKNEISENGE